jgi:hypothetical protein
MEEEKVDALSMLAFDPTEVDEVVESRKQEKKKDGRICICGHAMKHHFETDGKSLCMPSRIDCKCRHSRTVVQTSDVRHFLQLTTGMGPRHALSVGMVSASKAGKEVEWAISPVVCDYCKEPGKLLPVPLAHMSVFVDHQADNNVLLCQDCYVKGT